MSRCFSIFVAVAACLVAFDAWAEEILNIGDPAPALVVSSWVKGDKVEQFEPGKTYVVEFWATWCGPCRASIPHLTELAHQFKDKDVKFLGVDVWENDTKQVAPFLNEMGEKMDYNVALDKVAEGANPNDGTMAKTWMQAADEHGIPTAFVVRDGKIVWIGHPMQLEEPLTKITAGQWDAGERAKERLAHKTIERKANAVRAKIFTPFNAGDYKAAAAAIDEAIKENPDLEAEFNPTKFAALCNGGEIESGLALGEKLLAANNDQAAALNAYFWDVIDPDLKRDPDPRVAQLALRAARRAVELSKEEEPSYIDTMAEALYRTGDAEAAVAAEEKAIKILESQTKDPPNPAYLKEFKDHLDRYRKGIAKAAKT